MSWWAAVLWTLGIIAFGPALLVVGDPIDAWFQARQDLALRPQDYTHKAAKG